MLSQGDIAQLARAAALQAVGQGFESPYLHSKHLGKPGAKRRFLTTQLGKEDEISFGIKFYFIFYKALAKALCTYENKFS